MVKKYTLCKRKYNLQCGYIFRSKCLVTVFCLTVDIFEKFRKCRIHQIFDNSIVVLGVTCIWPTYWELEVALKKIRIIWIIVPTELHKSKALLLNFGGFTYSHCFGNSTFKKIKCLGTEEIVNYILKSNCFNKGDCSI